jgi:hypothetical protein
MRLVWFAERGRQQASRITLTKFCRCNNSSGDDFADHLGLAAVLKLFEGGIESFAHRRNRLRVGRCAVYEWTNCHGRYPHGSFLHPVGLMAAAK